MNCIRIIPDGQTLDITNQEIELVKLQSSYAQQGGIANDYTLPVQLVDSVPNQKVIQWLRDCKGTAIETELLSNGVPVLRGSKLKFIDQSDGTSSVQLVGNFYLWRSLLEGKFFCELFSFGSHFFTEQHIAEVQQRNGDSGELYTYPSIVWGDELIHKPAYFWKELLIRSFRAIGYELTYDGAIAELPAFRDLITPHFAGVVQTVKSNCIEPSPIDISEGEAGDGEVRPPRNGDGSSDTDISEPNTEEPCVDGSDDEVEANLNTCTVAQTHQVYELPRVGSLLDAEPILFEAPLEGNDPEGLFQVRQIQTQVGGETNIFEGYTLVPNSRGEYRIKVKFDLYRRCARPPRQGGGFSDYILFHTKTLTREASTKCDKPIYLYYTYEFADDFASPNKFIRVSLCGESEDVYRGDLRVCRFTGGVGTDDDVAIRPVDIKMVVTITVQKTGSQHVCKGEKDTNVVDLDLNCPNLQPLQLVNFLEESLGFMFLDKGQKRISMTHRLDHFGIPHQINAEDWRDIVNCSSAKETLIRAKYKELLKFTYQNDDYIPLSQYEDVYDKPLGEGSFEIADKNSTQLGEQVMNSSNVFSATAMIMLDNGLWLPQIGDAPFEEVNPRVLIYEGDKSILDDAEVEPQVKQYGLSYFYKENVEEDVVQLDFSNTHGLGLMDRLWWRYLQVIACGVEVEASVLLGLLAYQDLQMAAAKFFKSRDANGSLQLHYHFLNEVNFKVGADAPTACRFWQIPNLK